METVTQCRQDKDNRKGQISSPTIGIQDFEQQNAKNAQRNQLDTDARLVNNAEQDKWNGRDHYLPPNIWFLN
ncbi:MAG: hypothetical protein JETCAE02_05690 [Anaerolineaceae bacterium]|nr:MAG: hypothetical protein JETCAE02_05690 [Anaerolineaceae bacterium]